MIARRYYKKNIAKKIDIITLIGKKFFIILQLNYNLDRYNMTESFGIMDEGYFISRKQILNWVNSSLNINQAQIQNLGTGIVYCRLLQKAHPGIIPLNKLNLKAKHQYEYTQNFKLLQLGFFRLNIEKKIDIKKLSKCKYQDNLELIQWLKLYIDHKIENKNGNQTNRTKKISSIQLNNNKSKILSQSNLLNFQSSQSTQIYRNTARQKIQDEKQNFIKKSSDQNMVNEKLQKISQILKYQANNDQKIQNIKKILGLQN